MVGQRINAPIAYYGKTLVDRDIFPLGSRGDIWYIAKLQLKTINELFIKGRDKVYGDLSDIALKMEVEREQNKFDELVSNGSALGLFVRPLFFNTIMAQTYSILEIAMTDLCSTYDRNWKKQDKRSVSTIEKAKDCLASKGIIINYELWNEIDLWRNVRNDIMHEVGRTSETKAESYRVQLGIDIEISQSRIMLSHFKCVEYIDLIDRFIYDIFNQAPKID